MNKYLRLKELQAKIAAETATEAEKLEAAQLDEELTAGEEETEETVEIDETAVKAIADRVMKNVDSRIAAIETTSKKNFGHQETKDIINGTDLSPEQKLAAAQIRMVHFLKAISGNPELEAEGKNWLAKNVKIDKAQGSMNETTSVDGGYLVPPSEFFAEVQRLQNPYGVALANANVRYIKGVSYLQNKKTSGLVFTETAELGAGRLAGMKISQVLGTLRKFLAIAPVSNELVEDSAVDIWNELTIEFARALAIKQDELVFTDTTSGLFATANLALANVVTMTSGHGAYGSNDDLLDNMNDMMYGVPVPSMQNGKFYFHRSWMGILSKIKSTTGFYILDPATQTIWGRPYVLTEVLPAATPSEGLGTPFMVFGDLKYVDLVIRKQMELKMLDEATIGGVSGDTSYNLASQDAMALRGVVRMNSNPVFMNAFSILRTPLVS